MTSLKEIEKLYYKAIEDARLDEPAGGDLGPPGYSTEDFSRWTRKVDIFTLGKEAADFALKKHEEIVKEFGDYRRKLTEKLSKLYTYDGVSLPGQLKDIGSCWDGSKVGAVNEMDSLYIIQGDHFHVQEHEDKPGVHRVFLKIDSGLHEIKPRTIRDQFTQQYSQLVSELKLPNCLKHGGYKATGAFQDSHENSKSSYSDVRYNGPAVTSQFLGTDKTLLTWDITPAIVLPLDARTQDALRQCMQAIIIDNPEKMFPPSDVHLIPDVVDNIWKRSTAQMEADILRVLSKEGPMKKSLSFCKVLSSRLKQWNGKIETVDTAAVDMMNELLQTISMRGDEKTAEELGELQKIMRFGHIWLPSEKKVEYHEDTKSDISINNAAIKHILFKAGMKRKGAFASEANMDHMKELIKEVFETLGNEEAYSSEHAFLSGIRISHFSVSPRVACNKMTLIRDVCRQCRTLVQEAMTEPNRTADVDMLASELNLSVSTPRELRCGEYSFRFKTNPWQHPIFNEDIHRLLALLTPLCRGCGGVIYFLTDDMQPVTKEIFQVYRERLLALIGTNMETYPLPISMAPLSLLLGTHRAWAAVLLKKSNSTQKYPSVESKANKGSSRDVIFEIDIFGEIHTKSMLHTQRQSQMESGESPIKPTIPPTYSQETVVHQTEPETSPSQETVGRRRVDTEIPEVDFSCCSRLDWTENTKDWQKYVRIKQLITDDIIRSCNIWRPTQLMKITPDRDSLRYLFESEKDMNEALSAVTTMGPGCAVVCRTWRFHISDSSVSEELPPGHKCDILTLTDTGRLSFWVVVDSLEEKACHSQIEYLMTTGRMLKYQIAQKAKNGDLSNLWIDCRLLPVTTSHHAGNDVRLRLAESREIQEHLCHMYQDGVELALTQQTLTKLMLHKETPLKRCVGEHTSITLSAQQAEVLLHRAKVNYITGPAGSGKSYTGASLYKMYGMERSVYICTTKEFLEYLKFNGCTGTLVRCDQDLLREIETGTFENKICVVIDDCHKFTCTRKSLKQLFKLLKRNKDMSLFVFADNDYQSFDRKRQQAMQDCVLDLTRSVLQEVPLNFRLTDIYRNTRKIVSFVQAAIQDVYDGHQKIQSANMENGEGVECITIQSLWTNSPDNELVVYLCSLLAERYSQSEVAILLESSYKPEQIHQCKQIITENAPSITVQSAEIFPRTGVIVDSVDSFIGLDASVCVFILSNTRITPVHPLRRFLRWLTSECEMNMYNPRYEVFLASRATHKAVFVVPELHEGLIQQMKFDRLQPSAKFRDVVVTTRHRIQCGEWLRGFCYDDNKLYCVETREQDGTYTYWLTVYDVGTAQDGRLSLLDKVEVWGVCWDSRPRVDSSHRVYVPCDVSGVRIFRCQGGRLLPVREPLRCVGNAWSVCVNTADTVFVVDMDTMSVCLVNVSMDTVIMRLETPAHVWGDPYHVSVIGQTVMVCYGSNTLVTYDSDSLTPGHVLQTPEGLGSVTGITADSHSSSFIITGYRCTVYVLDERLLWHRIYSGDGELKDCAVVQSQLWLGHYRKDIAVLTSH